METAIPIWKTYPYGDIFLNPQMGTNSVWERVSDGTSPRMKMVTHMKMGSHFI
jgi:hypothetical protein